MDIIKQINIKNRTYYFYNDIIDLKDFDAKPYKNVDINKDGYITIKQVFIV